MRAGRGAATAVLTVLGVALGSSAAVYARPWPLREPAAEPRPAHQLRSPSTWPSEPAVPRPLDVRKFQLAFAHLCGVDPLSATAGLAQDIIGAAGTAKSDPFTLAALAYYGSRCDPDYHAKGAYGLLAIDPAMYRLPGAPAVPVPRDDLTAARLMDPVKNLTVGAALLEMWQTEHRDIDESFGGMSHRSGVAHFVWGDEVRSSGQEDLILTARRRMLAAYFSVPELPRSSPYGLSVVSPLEAPPRVATSGPGDDREGGARQHKGLDITGIIGEPVRSIANGTVIFAGVNGANHKRNGPIPPDLITRYARRRLGVGGVYLCIQHDPADAPAAAPSSVAPAPAVMTPAVMTPALMTPTATTSAAAATSGASAIRPRPHKVVSCYMHLKSYIVSEGDRVAAGQTVAFLGRTGVKISPPHLHFEVRVDDHFTNPVRTLGDYVIPPSATLTHQYAIKAKRARLKREKLRA